MQTILYTDLKSTARDVIFVDYIQMWLQNQGLLASFRESAARIQVLGGGFPEINIGQTDKQAVSRWLDAAKVWHLLAVCHRQSQCAGVILDSYLLPNTKDGNLKAYLARFQRSREDNFAKRLLDSLEEHDRPPAIAQLPSAYCSLSRVHPIIAPGPSSGLGALPTVALPTVAQVEQTIQQLQFGLAIARLLDCSSTKITMAKALLDLHNPQHLELVQVIKDQKSDAMVRFWRLCQGLGIDPSLPLNSDLLRNAVRDEGHAQTEAVKTAVELAMVYEEAHNQSAGDSMEMMLAETSEEEMQRLLSSKFIHLESAVILQVVQLFLEQKLNSLASAGQVFVQSEAAGSRLKSWADQLYASLVVLAGPPTADSIWEFCKSKASEISSSSETTPQ